MLGGNPVSLEMAADLEELMIWDLVLRCNLISSGVATTLGEAVIPAVVETVTDVVGRSPVVSLVLFGDSRSGVLRDLGSPEV